MHTGPIAAGKGAAVAEEGVCPRKGGMRCGWGPPSILRLSPKMGTRFSSVAVLFRWLMAMQEKLMGTAGTHGRLTGKGTPALGEKGSMTFVLGKWGVLGTGRLWDLKTSMRIG